MSQGSDAGVVVETDGVSVEKRFTADEFPVPAVRFTLRSEREAPAEFRIVDRIPDDFPMDRIGFHPEYDNDGWTAYQDHRVEYRRRLDPGEELTTVYGVRTDDPDVGSEFLGEPTVEEVDEDADPIGSVAEVIGDDSSQVVRDVLSGDRDTVPGGERAAEGTSQDPSAVGVDPLADDAATVESDPRADDARDASVEDAEGDGPVADEDGDSPAGDGAGSPALDEEDPVVDPETDAGDGSDEGDADDTDANGSDARPDAGGIASTLAAELRAGDVDPADRETLRRELELDRATSVDARIARLQSNVEDMAAYTDALEEFLDDNGTAEELAEGLRGEVADVREALSAVEADVAAADDRRDELETGLSDVRADVEGMRDDLSAATADLESSVSSLREDLDALAAEVAEEDDAVADVRDDVAALREEVATVSERVDDGMDDLRGELAEIRAEMREFEAFRDRLSSAFGAAGGNDPDGTSGTDGAGDGADGGDE